MALSDDMDIDAPPQAARTCKNLLDLPLEILERTFVLLVGGDPRWSQLCEDVLPLRLVHPTLEPLLTKVMFDHCIVDITRETRTTTEIFVRLARKLVVPKGITSLNILLDGGMDWRDVVTRQQGHTALADGISRGEWPADMRPRADAEINAILKQLERSMIRVVNLARATLRTLDLEIEDYDWDGRASQSDFTFGLSSFLSLPKLESLSMRNSAVSHHLLTALSAAPSLTNVEALGEQHTSPPSSFHDNQRRRAPKVFYRLASISKQRLDHLNLDDGHLAHPQELSIIKILQPVHLVFSLDYAMPWPPGANREKNNLNLLKHFAQVLTSEEALERLQTVRLSTAAAFSEANLDEFRAMLEKVYDPKRIELQWLDKRESTPEKEGRQVNTASPARRESTAQEGRT